MILQNVLQREAAAWEEKGCTAAWQLERAACPWPAELVLSRPQQGGSRSSCQPEAAEPTCPYTRKIKQQPRQTRSVAAAACSNLSSFSGPHTTNTRTSWKQTAATNRGLRMLLQMLFSWSEWCKIELRNCSCKTNIWKSKAFGVQVKEISTCINQILLYRDLKKLQIHLGNEIWIYVWRLTVRNIPRRNSSSGICFGQAQRRSTLLSFANSAFKEFRNQTSCVKCDWNESFCLRWDYVAMSLKLLRIDGRTRYRTRALLAPSVYACGQYKLCLPATTSWPGA